jgi:predicted amidophosphoribosyltransferase
MTAMQPRLERERRTVAARLRIYCRDRHGGGQELCAVCADLQRYTAERMAHCVLHPEKPTCATCAFRCYAPPKQALIWAVMRYAGPRLFWQHPLLALWHYFDTRYIPPR